MAVIQGPAECLRPDQRRSRPGRACGRRPSDDVPWGLVPGDLGDERGDIDLHLGVEALASRIGDEGLPVAVGHLPGSALRRRKPCPSDMHVRGLHQGAAGLLPRAPASMVMLQRVMHAPSIESARNRFSGVASITWPVPPPPVPILPDQGQGVVRGALRRRGPGEHHPHVPRLRLAKRPGSPACSPPRGCRYPGRGPRAPVGGGVRSRRQTMVHAGLGAACSGPTTWTTMPLRGSPTREEGDAEVLHVAFERTAAARASTSATGLATPCLHWPSVENVVVGDRAGVRSGRRTPAAPPCAGRRKPAASCTSMDQMHRST